MNLNLTPADMAEAFGEWFKDSDLDGKLTRDQVKLLAEAFSAGMIYGIARGIESVTQ